jgi:protein SCO1
MFGMVLAALALPVLADDVPYYDAADFTPHWLTPDSDQLQNFHRIPPFSFTNQDGDTVTEQQVAGRIYVASFFFSTCPGICPTIKSKLTLVQDTYRSDDAVLILSHSIRPTTDTPEVLQAYAVANHVQSGKWHLLTGDREAIYALAKSAYFASEDLGNIQDLTDFLHTENLLLIDQDRRIRGVYNGMSTSSVAHLMADIEQLKAQR